MSTDESAITVVFEATEADHYRAIRAAAARHPALRWMTLALLAAPLVLVALTMSNGYTLADAIMRNLFWIILAPLFVFVTGPLSQRSQARRARRQLEQGPAQQVFTFTPEGVRFGGGESHAALGWDQIRRMVETPDSMLLYVSAREAAYFPLSAVDPATLAALRRLIRRHLGAAKFESPHPD